jgi:hypothetical protein
LIGIIAGASALVNQIDPGRQRTQTTVGATQFKTHTLGGNASGIQPGVIQARTITPVHVAASDQLSGVAPASPKPVASKAPKPTVAPTAPAAATIPTGTGPAGGGSTGPGTAPGSGGTGSGSCSPLGGLLGGCQTKPAETGPQSGTTPVGQ